MTVSTTSVAPSSITGTSTICAGASTTLTASGGTLGTGATLQWYSGTCGGTSVGTGASITVSPSTSTTYYVRAEGTCDTSACASQLVTVNTAPVIVTNPTPSTTLVVGSSFTLSVVVSGTVSSYQWFRGSTLLTGATSSTLTIPSIVTGDADNHTCRVTGPCGTVTSAIGVLIIPVSIAGDPRCVPVPFEPTGVFTETAARNLGVDNPDCDTINSNSASSSSEVGEPFGSAAGAGGYQRTMWYRMNSPTCAATSVRFSTNTSPTDFNTRLTAYLRVDPLVCDGPMVELRSVDDDGAGAMPSASTVLLTPGTGLSGSNTFFPGKIIYAQVSGFSGASGNYGLIVDVDAPDVTLGAITASTAVVNFPSAASAYGTLSNVYLRYRKVGDPVYSYHHTIYSGSATTATITGLISGASYDVWLMYRCMPTDDRWVSRKVTFSTAAGCAGPIATPTVIASPSPLGVACSSVDVSWTPTVSATSYTIRWALASSPSRYSQRVITAPASSYTITGLLPGTNYIVWVITKCGLAQFTSPIASFSTCGALARMSNPDGSTEEGVYTYNNMEFHHLAINEISMAIDVENGEVNITKIDGTEGESTTPLMTSIKMIDNMSINPNPARTEATLGYFLPSESESMTITIFDAQGKEVSTELISDPSMIGNYVINLSNCSSGLYFVKATTGNFNETRKLLLDKD